MFEVQPNAGFAAGFGPGPAGNGTPFGNGLGPSFPGASLAPDGYAPMIGQSPYASPSAWNANNGSGSVLGSIMSQLMSLVGTLFSALTGSASGTGGSPWNAASAGGNGNAARGWSGGASGQQFYTTATAGSVGDPHLSFNGTQSNGVQSGATWDNMSSHADLLNSASFAGGYDVGSTVTAPDQNGITKNQLVSITTDNGATRVSLDNNGNASIVALGQQLAISPGQTLNLGNGENVTENANGSLSVTDVAANGGTLTTTLQAQDGGVNVNASANNVLLGGYLANYATGSTAPAPRPMPHADVA